MNVYMYSIVFFVFVIFNPIFGNAFQRKGHHYSPSVSPPVDNENTLTTIEAFGPPSFNDIQNNTHVVAQLRATASLRCHTHNLPDQLVTWMKRGDEQLLTAGLQVYSAERRYSVAHMRHQKVWELRIRDIHKSDEGIYECQMTTHPPIAILFNLTVVEARAVINGPRELHVNEGSIVTLHCHVDHATERPLYIFWFHNKTMINFGAKRPIRVTENAFTSKLTISNVTRDDAGSYRCEPHLATPANITLHIVAGESSAAMQREKSNSADENHFSPSSASNILIPSKFEIFSIGCLGIKRMRDRRIAIAISCLTFLLTSAEYGIYLL